MFSTSKQVRDAGPDAWLGREAPANPELDCEQAGPLALAAPAPLELASDAERASQAASQAIIAGPAWAHTARSRPLNSLPARACMDSSNAHEQGQPNDPIADFLMQLCHHVR